MLLWRLFFNWGTVTTSNRLRLEFFICSVSVGIQRGKSLFSQPDTAITVFSLFIQDFLNTHCGELVSVCEGYLANILLSENGTQDLNEDLMVRTFPWFKISFCGALNVK